MAGIGEYGSEGFSSYHAKKNPFIMQMQALSANPIQKESPARFLPILAAIGAAAAKVGTAVAATKVGGAIAAGAKALGSKIAATKVGGAVVKGAKAIKGIAAKVKGGKAFQTVKKGVETATKTMDKIKGSKAYQIGSRAKSELDSADQEGKAASSEALARGRSVRQSMPTIGSTSKATEHDAPVGESGVGETEEGSAFAYKSPLYNYRSPGKYPVFNMGNEASPPFKLRSGNSPLYKAMGREELIPSFKVGKKQHGEFKYL